MHNITAEQLIDMREKAKHLGPRAKWIMSSEVFLYIRKLKDDEQQYVYPPCWVGSDVPPLLGLPIEINRNFTGIDIYVPISTDDPVEHPAHYTSHPSGIECIQITEHMGFNLGNAVKYVWRADLKHDDAIEDLRKAVWYIEREIAKRGKHGK